MRASLASFDAPYRLIGFSGAWFSGVGMVSGSP